MADHFTVGLNLLDNSFNAEDARNYGLAIFFSDTQCTFCILDGKRNKLIALHQMLKYDVQQINTLSSQKISYPDFLKGVLTSMPWLKSSFRQVKIAYEGKKSTLIPSSLFDPARLEDYLQFNFQPGKDEDVLADHLISMDSYQVFTIPVHIRQSILTHFPGSRIVLAASVLIESVWINYKNRINAPRVFLNLCATFFNLMIFDGRQMSYFNTFAFQNPEDVTYYLIFVLEQLNLNPETIPLIMLGNVERGDELVELLFKYVRHVEFGRRNEGYKYSYALNQLPPHVHSPLFNFFSCGL
ncbi:MAG: DUF3822 family protein [Bacteroidota bacterium]